MRNNENAKLYVYLGPIAVSIVVTSWLELWWTSVQAAPAGELIEYEFASDIESNCDF